MLIPPNPRERRNHLIPMRFAPSIGLIDGSCGVSELLRTCTVTFRRNGHCRMSRAKRTHWQIEENAKEKVDHRSRRSAHATFLSRLLTHAIVYLEIMLPLRVQLILSESTEHSNHCTYFATARERRPYVTLDFLINRDSLVVAL